MKPRVLVVTSCTGEKLYKPDNQLTLDDFKNNDRLLKRERELAEFQCTAGEMYTGAQHLALMKGIKEYRNKGGEIDLYVLSAGYGLLSESEKIVPYEVTFNTMDSQSIKKWSRRQQISEDLQAITPKYDLIFFLLGDKYLQSIEWPLKINDEQQLIFFAGGSSKSRVLNWNNYHVLAIGEREAKELRYGLIGIKGFLFAKLISEIANHDFKQIWTDILKTPQMIRKIILNSVLINNQQIDMFKEVIEDDSLLEFYSELFFVPDHLIAKNFINEPKFFLPENDDRVDPHYDFIQDYSDKERNPLLNDVYAHEMHPHPQYDGLLVSKVNIDGATQQKKGLMKELGMHDFYRLSKTYPIMGDCGAFSYIGQETPPYETEEIIDYYHEMGFDYGVSIDHLIVGAFQKNEEIRNQRYDLTLKMAEEFIETYNVHKEQKGYKFHPIGIVQGWDPASFKKAVNHLIELGYDYIALGGLAREQSGKIFEILKEISPIIPNEKFRMHLFGVARDVKTMKAFHKLGVTSFDSSSPLRRAWLGSGHNYHAMSGKHYTAIRIPEAKETSGRVKKLLQSGNNEINFSIYKNLEQQALAALRMFDAGKIDVEAALEAILEYDKILGEKREAHEDMYREVLSERPWEQCDCAICKSIGIDVIVFRGNNRNRRRGFHNTYVYYSQIQELKKSWDK